MSQQVTIGEQFDGLRQSRITFRKPNVSVPIPLG